MAFSFKSLWEYVASGPGIRYVAGKIAKGVASYLLPNLVNRHYPQLTTSEVDKLVDYGVKGHQAAQDFMSQGPSQILPLEKIPIVPELKSISGIDNRVVVATNLEFDDEQMRRVLTRYLDMNAPDSISKELWRQIIDETVSDWLKKYPAMQQQHEKEPWTSYQAAVVYVARGY